MAIATNIFVTKPQPILCLMRQGIPESHVEIFWGQLTISDLSSLIETQRPSPDKVAASLKTEVADLRPAESAVYYFLIQFVRSLQSDELQAFLQFVTGSVDMPVDGIRVSFFSTSSEGRHVVAHTCSNTIELSTAYSSYQEFRREVLSMLHDEHCLQFTLP